jgi:hypothetical protein
MPLKIMRNIVGHSSLHSVFYFDHEAPTLSPVARSKRFPSDESSKITEGGKIHNRARKKAKRTPEELGPQHRQELAQVI